MTSSASHTTYPNQLALRENVGIVDAKTYVPIQPRGNSKGSEQMFGGQYIQLSPYTPKGYLPSTDHIRQTQSVLVTDNLGPGRTTSFTLEKAGTFLEWVDLYITVSAVTPGAGATYARFGDFAGLLLLSRVIMKSTEQEYDSFLPIKKYLQTLRSASDEEYREYIAPLAGDLSKPERNARALAPQTFRVRIPCFWDNMPSKAPVLSAIARLLKIDFKFADIGSVLESDSILSTFTITQLELCYEVGNVPGFEQNIRSAQALTNTGVTNVYEDLHDTDLQEIAAGLSSIKIKLNNFNLPTMASYGTLTRAASYAPFANKEYLNYDVALLDLISEVTIQDSQNVILQTITSLDDIVKYWMMCHDVVPYRKSLIFWRAAFNAKPLCYTFTGSNNPANMSDYAVVFKFKAPLAEKLYYVQYNFEPNFVIQQGGELQRVFAP